MSVATAQLTNPPARFLRWWLGELKACLPGARPNGTARHSRAVLIQMMSDEAVFHQIRRKKGKEIGRIALNAADNSVTRKQLNRIRRLGRQRRTDVILCLPPESVLQHRVHLPLAALENLEEVLGFEMERFTAFKSDEVYFSHRLLEANSTEKRVAVKLVVVPRTAADAAIGTAKAWGLDPDVVTLAADDLSVDRTINLLPKLPSVESGRGLRRLLQALSLVAIGFASIASYLEIRQQERLLSAHEASLTEGRARSRHAAELRVQLGQLLVRSQYVAERKQSQPLLIEVLDETTRLLPDNTWVTQFQLDKGKLTISGFSVAASSLIELLEASPLLSQVKFSSPVTLDPKQGVERFNITADVAAKEDLS